MVRGRTNVYKLANEKVFITFYVYGAIKFFIEHYGPKISAMFFARFTVHKKFTFNGKTIVIDT